MLKEFKKFIIGKPLSSAAIKGEKFSILFGLAILASDAVSSVAYAVEAILLVLIPVLGSATYCVLMGIVGAIIALLMLLVLSYRQTINAYPNGGGAYTVATDNLGIIPGLFAGASLSVDYILTAAISTTAGTDAITSAFPALYPFRISLALGILALVTLVNLRGLKESSRIFSLPTYIFLFSTISLIITGLIKYVLYGMPAVCAPQSMMATTGTLSLFLLLKAFSAGCTALTGIEAVSNSVPNFRKPTTKNANIVLSLLALMAFIIFGGISLLTTIYHVAPIENGPTVLSHIASLVFGTNAMYYLFQFSTAVILFMASNTAFNGFPMIMSIMAKDGFVPRQLMLRGHRLSYSNGILILCVISSVLIIIFCGSTQALVPLYAVGVFSSFTLSQSGMCLRWVRIKGKNWQAKAIINGLGALFSASTVIILGVTKFISGAWIVILLIPLIVKIMLNIKKHYDSVEKALKITNFVTLKNLDFHIPDAHHAIVAISDLNKAAVETLQYAKSLFGKVTAIHIAFDKDETTKLRDHWNQWDPQIPLVIKYSPYREIIEPLVEYIEMVAKEKQDSEIITILMPQFLTFNAWENYLLHNQTSLFLRQALLNKEVIVTNYPYYVDRKK
jgi:amino acid transporter